MKINGKKLYEYAREGKEVEIKSRKVTISELKILNFDEEKRTLELYIACSKGTYIRSLANDLGEKLGTYGHLKKLMRVKAGDFTIENAKMLEDLNTVDEVQKNLITPLEYLNYPKIDLNDIEAQKINNGMELCSNIFKNGTTILVYKNLLFYYFIPILVNIQKIIEYFI